MGKLLHEEKALGICNNQQNKCFDQCKDFNLEEKVLSAFYVQDHFEEANHGFKSASGDDYEDDESDSSSKERAFYWESQQALLQEILERYSLTAQKLRQEVRRILEASEREFCRCTKPSSNACLRRILVDLLSKKGFNASLCTSKWKRTKKFPGGTHEYIEVTANSLGRKKQILLLIELEFRDQFKIAKSCKEYTNLVAQLPEIYVGKLDFLNAIVRILCNSAKKSMKEKKIYMGPWRKKSFMEMKWSSSLERKPFEQ
ncbi:hypothetical protein LWI28_001493 [Acer negundo]|uniref:DUF506 family protein n=1 Tax=Acer negundo TaxID=4023 RepID=A0AAD5JV09_ACENE|nr:hypothetical protein LWI28_001493 [Acer negundo]KAK4860604.1 hypothetical protein QYF36_027045 [Acer negundo]